MNRTVIAVIGISMVLLTVLTMVALMVESKKAALVGETARTLVLKKEKRPEGVIKDYSRFQTIRGGDDREMVQIPAGPFLMGGGQEGNFDEHPQRGFYLDAYYIDLYEVTHAEYRRFAKMLNRPMPVIPVFEDDVRLLQGDRQPVVGVMWVDAFAYCAWAGGRLPTEAEWEKAAHGESEIIWPWGNEFSPYLVNGRGEEDGYKYTAPVGSFEGGRSPYGVYDMAGNVSEWVSDWYNQFYYKTAPFNNPKGPEVPDLNKVVVYRGGSYLSTMEDLRGARRFGGAHPERGENTVGFRCVREANKS